MEKTIKDLSGNRIQILTKDSYCKLCTYNEYIDYYTFAISELNELITALQEAKKELEKQ